MNILFVIEASFNPFDGGVQRTTYKLGKYFHENGYKVSYLSLKQVGHMEEIQYGELHQVEAPGGANSERNRLFIRKCLWSIRPDIVINQYPYNRQLREILSHEKEELGYHLLGCLRNSLFSFKDNIREKTELKVKQVWLSKLLTSTIGLKVIHLYHFIKHRRDLKRIIDQHDYFILLAPPNRKELEYFVGHYKPDKVHAIPNSIPKVHEPGAKENLLLYVGRLDVSQKRADLLIKLWQKLQPRISDWKFVIVGDGPYREKLLNEIERHNLSSIESVGYADPAPYYEKASVLVMTSAYEGFPNVLLESHSYGVVPVIFNSYSAAPWAAEDGVNAFLLEPFDLEGMADRVEQLAENPEELSDMMKNARSNASRFTIDRVGNQWEDFFKKIQGDEGAK